MTGKGLSTKQAERLQVAFSLHGQGRLAEARTEYQRLLRQVPGNALLLANLGMVEIHLGNVEAGADLLRRSLVIDPGQPEVLANYGAALTQLGRIHEALRELERALRLDRYSTTALTNKGLALAQWGKWEQALSCFDSVLERQDPVPSVLLSRANCLVEIGRADEALAEYDRVARLDPRSPQAWCGRAGVLRILGRGQDALESYRQALAIAPFDVPTLTNLGAYYLDTKRYAEAADCLSEALVAPGGNETVLGSLIFAKLQIGDWEGIDGLTVRLLDYVQRDGFVPNPLVVMAVTSDPILQRRVAVTLANRSRLEDVAAGPVAMEGASDDGEPMRIGYFSGDFRDHPVTYLMTEILRAHDRTQVQVIGFSFGPRPADSSVQAQIEACFDRFVDVRGKTDAEVARLAQDMGIQIAVDLTGYTQSARPGIFAHRVAPVQAGYLAYPGTMGTPYHDYLIADPVVVTKENRAGYTEKIAYLPDCYLVNDRRSVAIAALPSRSSLGLPEHGIVFCCFNNTFKIGSAVFDVWMQILKRVPGSVLWLFEGDRAASGRLRAEAEKRGVHSQRLVFAGRVPAIGEHLARYRVADLFLDTEPYNAHTTASDALWMGLPVLTRAGPAFASRVAASLLNTVGLCELITDSGEAYIEQAVQLANDPARLGRIRDRLAAVRHSSPLFDGRRLAANLECLYRKMLDRNAQGLRPEDILPE
jgi:protein O-GlcNAc transferase